MKKMETPEIEFKTGDDAASAFQDIVKAKGEKTAVIFNNRKITWNELGSKINRVANTLIKKGIKKNDRVAIMSKNSVEYIETFFGAISAGACAVPLPTMASSDSIKLMLEDSMPKVIIISDEYRKHVNPFIDNMPFIMEGGKIAFNFDSNGWKNYNQWIEGASIDVPDVIIRSENEFNIIYSSGTTGVPKGITHTHAIRKAFCNPFQPVFGMPNMINIISTPFYSNTTMVTWLASMRFGATSVVMEKFDANTFLKLCEREKVTIAMLVPVQYDRILRVKDFNNYDLSSMMIKFCTSAPLLPEMKRKILDMMPGELVDIYGMTEGGVTSVLFASHSQDKLDSVGQPPPGCEIKIIDEDGNELDSDKIGELVGRQPFMMTGYQNREDATNEMIWYDKKGNLFFRSGDLGRIDKDGFVYILDRKKDVIISGGFNIFAIDLEKELLTHEAVREAAVIGIPSEAWGETPLAFVVLEDDFNETPENILEWVNARLGKGQRISKVELIDEIPKSNIGKVLKKEIRKPYWDKVK